MDDRLKKNITAGRESRASQDSSRAAPEDKSFMSSEERRTAFRSEWMQEALPTPPAIPGFHLCWLSSTNQYDPIHKRMRMGYTQVKAEELKGFDQYAVKAGEHAGFVACNEMLLFKLPEDVYQDIMLDLHHYAPMQEQEKIKVQQEQLLDQRDSNGKSLVSIEGDGMRFSSKSNKLPVFE